MVSWYCVRLEEHRIGSDLEGKLSTCMLIFGLRRKLKLNLYQPKASYRSTTCDAKAPGKKQSLSSVTLIQCFGLSEVNLHQPDLMMLIYSCSRPKG